MKKRTGIRIISFTLAAFTASCGFAVRNKQEANAYKKYIEHSHMRAMSELVENMSNISTTLQKGIYISEPSLMASISAEIWREASNAKTNISELPLSSVELDSTNKFISQVGDYAFFLTKKAAQNEILSEDELKNLTSLMQTSKNFTDSLVQLQSKIYDGSLLFDNISSSMHSLNSSDPSSLASTYLSDVEEEFPEYATLIYDGPLSEHIEKLEAEFLKGKAEITIDEARKIILNLEKKLGVPSKPFENDFEDESTPIFKLNVFTLWKKAFRVRTLMLWLAWFGIVFSYYGIFMWLPSIVFTQGFEVVKTFEYVLIMTLAQLPGYFAAAWLVDIIGRRYTLSSFLLMSGVCAYFFGNAENASNLLMWGAAMSFFNLGAWGVIYTYTPELYPTAIRALGSGWAAGFGRIGGMLAPMLVGVLLVHGAQINSIFLMFASVFVIISVVVLSLGIESKKKSLEEIDAAFKTT